MASLETHTGHIELTLEYAGSPERIRLRACAPGKSGLALDTRMPHDSANPPHNPLLLHLARTRVHTKDTCAYLRLTDGITGRADIRRLHK